MRRNVFASRSSASSISPSPSSASRNGKASSAASKQPRGRRVAEGRGRHNGGHRPAPRPSASRGRLSTSPGMPSAASAQSHPARHELGLPFARPHQRPYRRGMRSCSYEESARRRESKGTQLSPGSRMAGAFLHGRVRPSVGAGERNEASAGSCPRLARRASFTPGGAVPVF